MNTEADLHFLIDNAPPTEVEYTLRELDPNISYSTKELRERIYSGWGYEVQRNYTNSTRRLYDLGLSKQEQTEAGKPGHILTKFGEKIRGVLSMNRQLYKELMHYLHYTSYDREDPSSRKLFWSYRKCCNVVWSRRELPKTSEIVKIIQNEIAEKFPDAYASTDEGGRFNSGGVSSGWKPWIIQLDPPVFKNEDNHLAPRKTDRFELVLLAIDHVYKTNKYRFGDPVVLDEPLLDQIAKVFFLDPVRTRELIDMASKLTKTVKLADTFAGTSITMNAPYSADRI